MTEIVLGKLDEAFQMAFTDKEACLHAGINPDTLYEYCKKHPEYAERKEVLKKKPNMMAKRNLFNQLADGDANTSKWQLERRDDEYKPKSDNKHTLEGVDISFGKG